MTPQKASLVYFSPTGTTQAVLTSIGEGTGLPCRHIDMTKPDARIETCRIAQDELLIIGFPVYGGRIPAIHETILPLLPSGNNPVVPVVVYGNRAYDDALAELADLCAEKGFSLTGAGAFIGEHSYSRRLGTDRPGENDKLLAREFGSRLMASLQQGKTLAPLSLPGNRPYKERSPKLSVVPETSEDCTRCMLCAEACPTGAISAEQPEQTDPEKCILCAACVKKCPVQAKQIRFQPLLQRMEAIAEANLAPKQPEIFLP